jgi:hypothetical protein
MTSNTTLSVVYAELCVFDTVMLSVIMMNVIMLNVVVPYQRLVI